MNELLEKIIDIIGRLLSKIFGRLDDIKNDVQVKTNKSKEQINVAKTQTKSTLNISISGEQHVDYFKGRVIGEFIKVLASYVPYRYEQSSKKYVAYFVRKRNRNVIEYIKFSKDSKESKSVDISYSYINKLISKNGIRSEMGNTTDSTLVLDSDVISGISYAVSGKKSPYYLCFVEPKKTVEVGNPTFIVDSWLSVMNLIKVLTNNYFKDFNSKQYKEVEGLMQRAGFHMVMSYFKSVKDPYYRTAYRTCHLKTIVDAIKDYNSLHFNSNKITNFTYDKDYIREKPNFSMREDGFTVRGYGICVTYTGKPIVNESKAFEEYGYKLASFIAKNNDKDLCFNFIFYIISTGGIHDADIVELKELYKEVSKETDSSIVEVNNSVEPEVSTIMEESNFIEDEDGDLTSKLFESTISDNVKAKASTIEPASIPEVMEPIKVKDISIKEEEVKTEDTFVSPVKAMIEEAKVVQKEDTSEEEHSIKPKEFNTNSLDMISALKQTVEEDTDVKVVGGIKKVSEVISKPPVDWTLEECKEILKGEYYFDTIKREDVIDRMLFLSAKEGK